MLPTINGKSLLECSLDDFKTIIDNPDFKESLYLDYKRDFDIIRCDNKTTKQEKISEFRSDVCSFANSAGGYLIMSRWK